MVPPPAEALAAAADIDDATLLTALEEAHLPSLLPVLALLTGTADGIGHLRPARYRLIESQGGMTPAQQRQVRALAFDVISAWRDGQLSAKAVDSDTLRPLLAPIFGDDAVDDYLPMAVEELALHGEDLRAPRWQHASPAADAAPPVVVIGAGMSGILAALRLGQAGVPHVVLEKNPTLGGTWFENTYPGCRVDVPSHLYTYSCAPDEEWTEHYATQPTILAGFARFAAASGVEEKIRFGVTVEECLFDEARRRWVLTVRTAAGSTEVLEASAVISAVGQLNRPHLPDIGGRERFAGPAFHTARWDHGVSLAGKRVAVIGTGASAMQLLPHIAAEAALLVVFQRTPAWMLPSPTWQQDVPEGMRWLLRTVPYYQRFYRLWLFATMSDGLMPYGAVDEDWDDGGRSVSRLNARFRGILTDYLEEQFAARPDLLPLVTPSYPPFAKRIVRDDGGWAATLCDPKTTLVTAGIASITETGVTTVDGRHHEVDVIIYGTGFSASKFLTPMRVVGRDGADLHARWGPDAGAYLGVTVPGFPNFFMLYGPNTNIVLNGSVIFFSECEVRYVLGCLQLAREKGGGPVDVHPEVYDAYVDDVDRRNRQMAWGASAVNSWYKSASGRVTQNWPSSVLEYWQRTRQPDPAEYEVLSDDREGAPSA